MQPPFEITPVAADLLSKIERLLGRHEGALTASASPILRRSQRIKTIHSTLAIEGNTLTEEQVTAVLEGRPVIAPERDLREVHNAIACYENVSKWNSSNTKHLLAAHKLLMSGLVERPGAWRNRSVGIVKGSEISHIAPPWDRVPGLMGTLFEWLKKDKIVPLPIRAAVCHYEMEFIHPFEDGNGRMGRLWHTLILSHYHPLFLQFPIESLIRSKQAEYYEVLGQCDKVGNSNKFIEFSLEVTLHALTETSKTPAPKMIPAERMETARQRFPVGGFSRKDYLGLFPMLSSATASRDLGQAVENQILERQGEKSTARYWFL